MTVVEDWGSPGLVSPLQLEANRAFLVQVHDIDLDQVLAGHEVLADIKILHDFPAGAIWERDRLAVDDYSLQVVVDRDTAGDPADLGCRRVRQRDAGLEAVHDTIPNRGWCGRPGQPL